MAESDANPFQQIVDAELEKMGTNKQPSKRTTGSISMLKDIGVANPRTTATAVVGGSLATSAVKKWKSLYKEGLVTLRARAAEEAKAVKELAGKGIQAFPRLTGTNAEIKALANQYATERVFAGLPFVNQKAANRVADLKTGRVVLTGETTAGVRSALELNRSPALINYRPYETSVGVAQPPKQVTVETAKGIPKLKINAPSTAPYVGSDWDYNNPSWSRTTEPRRISSAPEYVPRTAPNPNLATRLAETSTSGYLGKTNLGLEAAATAYDLVRPEGTIARGYEEGGKGGVGVAVAGLRGLGRLGRGAANALTLGTPELLGIYDVPDLIGVDMDAEKRYMQLRGTAGYPAENFPVERKNGRYVPVEGPALDMIASRLAAERGIETSPMTRSYYKGPEYNYILSDGKVEAVLRPEYSAMYDARSIAAMDAANARRPVLNIDPSLGGMGWQRLPQAAPNFADYIDYMAQPR
jgi:hypothetical protein